MSGIGGSYFYRLQMDGKDLPFITSTYGGELTVIQDLYKYLPMLRWRTADPTGALTHFHTLDRAATVTLRFGYNQEQGNPETWNEFKFAITRRMPENDNGISGSMEMTGVLDCPKLFAPDYSRSFSGSVAASLADLAKEMGFEKSEIDSNLLNQRRTLLQPSANNAWFLNYHRETLTGTDGRGGYHCFVKVKGGQPVFVFRGIRDLAGQPVAYQFMLGDQPYADQLPVFRYEVVDNYRLLGAFLGKTQPYSYFNYSKGEFVQREVDLQEYLSLSEFYAIRKDDNETGSVIQSTGRSNSLTADFRGRATTLYWDKLTQLSKIWLTGDGLPNVTPGDVVTLKFSQGFQTKDFSIFQYGGYWLVERVVHTMTDAFRTRLLLTRSGVSGRLPDQLIKAEQVKKDSSGATL